MNLDEELCLCFHVSKRKVVNFLRVERPQRASQLSQCFGAGTGCGWCRAYLTRLFEEYQAGQVGSAADLAAADYAKQRAAYIRAGGGTPPPGATPVPEASDE
ncbi:MAG: (2Fe-2S)-binding protein [Planctomycetes bacterium]|nr:(2Fe-2S)-binding protein [Planctomycetota bacterium]